MYFFQIFPRSEKQNVAVRPFWIPVSGSIHCRAAVRRIGTRNLLAIMPTRGILAVGVLSNSRFRSSEFLVRVSRVNSFVHKLRDGFGEVIFNCGELQSCGLSQRVHLRAI